VPGLFSSSPVPAKIKNLASVRQWLSLIGKRAKRAIIGVAKYATHRAARPDPSLRKERLLGMTIKLSHYLAAAESINPTPGRFVESHLSKNEKVGGRAQGW
jgi:hypothetical protein